MPATAEYWDSADLKALAAGGLINEAVMQKIFDISKIPLPLTERIGSGSTDNEKDEWTTDELPAPNIANAVVSGSDAVGNDAKGGARVANHCQNSVKVVEVTERAQDSDTVGRSNEFSYQLLNRGDAIRRDVEAIALTGQASVADNGDAIAGKVGALASWIKTNVAFGVGGAPGGFNAGTGLTVAPTKGNAHALTYAALTDTIEKVYNANGDVTVFMSVPGVIKRLARFLFTAGAPIAVPTADVSGTNRAEQVAQGYIPVLVTDFGTTLSLVPNRIQQTYASADAVAVQVAYGYLLDLSMLELAYLKNYVTRPIAKLGLADRAMISVDWTLRVFQEKAFGLIADIDPTAPVVA